VTRASSSIARTPTSANVTEVRSISFLPHLRQFLRARPSPVGLTPREREVIALVADGSTNGEVAHALRISPETVRKHLENAYDKLGVHTRTAAVKAVFGR